MPIEFLDDVPSPQSSIEFLDEAPQPSGNVEFLDAPPAPMTADDIRAQMNAPGSTFLPTLEQAAILRKADNERPLGESVGAGLGAAWDAVKYLGGTEIPRLFGELSKSQSEQYEKWRATPPEDRKPLTSASDLFTLGEGFARGTSDLYELLRRGATKFYDTSPLHPGVPLPFHIPAAVLFPQDTDEKYHKRITDNLIQQRQRQEIAEGKDTTLFPKELVNPAGAELLSYVADPTIAAPQLKLPASLSRALGKTAAKAVTEAAQVAEKAGSGIQTAAKIPEQIISKVLPEQIVRPTTLGGAVAGTLGLGGPVAQGAAVVKGAQVAGATLEKSGQFARELAKTTGESQFSRLQQLAMSEGVAPWVRGAARNLSRLKVDTAAGAAAGFGSSVAKGAAIGTALSAPGAENAEEIGAAAGSGATLGGLAHVAFAPFASPLKKRAAEDADIVRWFESKSPEEQAALSQLGLDRTGALKAMTAEALANGVLSPGANIKFTYLPGDVYEKQFGRTRGVERIQGAVPELVINADRAKGRTLYHELFHALDSSPDIVDFGALSRLMFDLTDDKGQLVSKGLLSGEDMKTLGDQYFSRFDDAQRATWQPGKEAFEKNANSPEGSAWKTRMAREIAAEMFANLSEETGGSLIKDANSISRRVLDRMIQSDSPRLNALAEKLGGAPKVESDVFPGLKATPKLYAALRDAVRNKGDLIEKPDFDSQPTVDVAIDPAEALKPGGEKIAERFADNDVFKKNPDGSLAFVGGRPVLLTEGEIKRVQADRVKAITDALSKISDAGDSGAMRVVDGGFEGKHFTPEQLAAIDQIPGHLLTPLMKEKIRKINDLTTKGDGSPVLIHYNSATSAGRDKRDPVTNVLKRGTRKYSSKIRESVRVVSPLSQRVTKAGNYVITGLDITAFSNKLTKWMREKKRAFKDFNGEEGFTEAVFKYLENHQNNRPGETGLDANPQKALRMKNRINDFFNIRDKASEGLNPDRLSTASDKDNLIRSFRFDRINRIDQAGGDKFPIDYSKQKANFSPEIPDNQRVHSNDLSLVLKDLAPAVSGADRPSGWAKDENSNQVIGFLDGVPVVSVEPVISHAGFLQGADPTQFSYFSVKKLLPNGEVYRHLTDFKKFSEAASFARKNLNIPKQLAFPKAVGKSRAPKELHPGTAGDLRQGHEAKRRVEDRFFSPAPSEEIRWQADQYAKKATLDYKPYSDYVPVSEDLAKRAADAYQEAQHKPNDPEVKRAYQAFKDETLAQWDYLTSKGVRMEPWVKEGQPYTNSADMVKDVRENKHLWFFLTEQGYGSDQGGQPMSHPLLEKAGMKVNGKDLLINDVFRAVHDYFGHAKENYEFGPRGEYNAFLTHYTLYSDQARPALAAETLGQNSWVNYGSHLRRRDGALPRKGEAGFIPPAERPFADQKATLLPAELVSEAVKPLEGADKANELALFSSDIPTQYAEGEPLPHSVGKGVSIPLVHYTSRDLQRLDPKFLGKGKATKYDLRGDNKVFLFVAGSPLGRDAQFFGTGSSLAYGARVDGSRIYDLSDGRPDPLNWNGRVNRLEADEAVQEAGYVGILIDTGEADGRQVVLMFKPIDVKPLEVPTSGDRAPRIGLRPETPPDGAQVQAMAKTIADLHAKNGGVTFTPTENRARSSDEPAYALSIYPERSQKTESTPPQDEISRFIIDNWDLLRDPKNSVGTWHDTDSGLHYLDVSVVIPNRERAIALGKRYNQKAIWDLQKGEAIETGGTGEPVSNVPRETDRVLFSPDTMITSAVEILHKDSAEVPPPISGKKRTNDQVAALLQEAALRQWGRVITSNDIKPEETQTLVDNGVEEVVAALGASGKNAANWYTKAIERAVKVMGVIHPELADEGAAKAAGFPNQRAAELGMMVAMATTSQNLSVQLNSRFAEEQFQALRNTGKFDPDRQYGEKARSISSNLDLANTFVSELGWEGVEKFVKSDFTVKELASAASKIAGKKINISGRVNDVVQGAAIFGPKIGQGFLQNLFGNYNPVTIDLWMRRTWGRWTGDVVGDGVTPKRLARLLDAARERGIALPEELKKVRTVVRKNKSGSEFKSVSDNVVDALEAEPEVRETIVKWAKELTLDWQKRYQAVRTPLRPHDVAAFRAGTISLDALADKQLRILARLDAHYKSLAKKPGKKEVWRQERLAKLGHTEKLSNAEISGGKPDWAGAASTIITDLKPVDVPTDQDRAVISQVVNGIRASLKERHGIETSNADIQAILWYPEKDLWAKLRGEKESNLKQSYDEEFLKIAEARGLGAKARAIVGDGAARDSSTPDPRPAETVGAGVGEVQRDLAPQ
jgi:hypothetical protein